MDGAQIVIGGDYTLLDKAIATAFTKFASFGNKIKGNLDKIADKGGVLKMIGDALSKGLQKGSDDAKEILNSVVAISEATSQKIKEAFQNAFGFIGTVAMKAVDGLASAWSAATSVITAPFKAAYTAVSSFASSVRAVFGSVVGYAKSLFGSLTSYIQNVFSEAYGAVKQLMPLLGASIQDGLSAGFAGVKEDEVEFSRMAGLIKSTGGVAGFAADQLSDMANAAAAASGSFGGDAFAGAYATLLQFKNLRGSVFLGATKAIEDMAVATGGDLSAAADKLGRALDDPIRGVRVLKSEGIKFTETEVKMIEQMMAAGQVLRAQQAILQRVGETYKGNAAVAAGTFTGKLRILNQAIEDQWKAWAQALIPAIEAVIPYLMKSALAVQRLGEKFGELVKWTLDWASKSQDTIQKWYDKAVDIFLSISDVIVDSIAKAFAFVQTVVQDFPGAFKTAKAKAMVVWEELTQGLKTAWETIGVYVQNGWDSIFSYLKKKFIDLTAFIVKAGIDLQVKLGTMSKGDGEKAKKQITQAAGFAKQLEEERFKRSPKAKVSGPTEEDKARLEALRSEAQDVASDFGNRFQENLNKSKGFFDSVKGGIRSLVKGVTDDAGNAIDEKFKESAQDFIFSKDAGSDSTGGAFEDLVGLQKRIQGAAFKDPAATAIGGQTQVIKAQHMETIKEQKEQQKKLDKQIEATERLNETIKGNVGEGELIG